MRAPRAGSALLVAEAPAGLQEDAVAPDLPVVEDAVRRAERLDLLVPLLDALRVRHARVRDALRQQLVPRLHGRVEEVLLRAEVAEVVRDLVVRARELRVRVRERRRLRRDRHLGLAVKLDEVALRLLLGRLRLGDGALEVAHDDVEHAQDARRGRLRARVRLARLPARVRHRVVGRLLGEDRRLGGLAVEVRQDVHRLLHGVDALLGVRDRLLVLGLLLVAVLLLRGEVRRQVPDLVRELLLVELERVLLGVAIGELVVELGDVTEAGVAVLRRLGELLVAPALVVGLVGLLREQALDELLDHALDLVEHVGLGRRREAHERRALELLGLAEEHGHELLPLHVLVRVRRLRRLAHAHLQEARRRGGVLVAALRAHRVAAADARLSGLGGDDALDDGERLRDSRELVRAHGRALVPLLRLRLALGGEVLEVEAVVVQDRVRLRQVRLRLGDVLRRRGAQLLLLRERHLGRLDLRRLALRREVEVRLRLRVLRLERALLVAEGAEEALQRADDAARLELVVLVGDAARAVVRRLDEEGEDVLVGLDAVRVGRQEGLLHRRGKVRLEVGGHVARLGRLERLDRPLQGADGLGHVLEGGVESRLLRLAHLRRGLELVVVRLNVGVQRVDLTVERVAVRLVGREVRLQRADRGGPGRDGVRLLVRLRLAEARELIVRRRLGLAFLLDLRLQVAEHRDYLLDRRHVGRERGSNENNPQHGLAYGLSFARTPT